MKDDRLGLEAKAYSALLKLMEYAKEARQLFDAANLPLPQPLLRLIGDGVTVSAPPRMSTSPPQAPERPQEASNEWIWIRLKDLSVTLFIVGVLKQHGSPLSPKEIHKRIKKYIPNANIGSIFNVGARLDGTDIRRTGGGWSLINPEKAPAIVGDYAWGKKSIFSKWEMAAHRREGILHLLKSSPGGLQNLQITQHLEGADWCQAPVNKDLVKADLEFLKNAGHIKRRGNSRKWAVVGNAKNKR